jgi:short-chain fatty acids transporter
MLFPFYAGIMGLMNYSGITASLSELISKYASETTFPLFSFFSSALVNLFVPSGGGQWAVQGPLLLKTSLDLNLPLNQTVMAFSYGDELTNMLQPFWALPLLGITQVKAKEIIPYSMMIMLISVPIFILGIYLY